MTLHFRYACTSCGFNYYTQRGKQHDRCPGCEGEEWRKDDVHL